MTNATPTDTDMEAARQLLVGHKQWPETMRVNDDSGGPWYISARSIAVALTNARAEGYEQGEEAGYEASLY